MSEDFRPDPDDLLSMLKRESDSSKGRLRIFMGMSAGVGKTYAMLRAGHQALAEKVDIVVGLVETHGRKETLELLEGLPLLPRKRISYRGADLEEMDLDAILKRNPELVLVDELAHTNVPGARHPKRFHDVLELLDRGIDVYTTVNVQHLESRKEAVEAITGIQIHETVPDSVLDRAELVELVDIAPTELLKRLREGKVYIGEKAQSALNHFFKEDTLTALREIALRLTAERVDHDLQKFIQVKTSGGAWHTKEKLMVAISHSPYSVPAIRATRRLAYNLEAPWLAVYVNTGVHLRQEDQNQLTKNMNLVRDLGSEVITVTATDVAGSLKRIAKQKQVTQMVIGRPTRRFVKDSLEGGTLLDQLVRSTWDIDIHVVRHRRLNTSQKLFYLKFSESPFSYWNALWCLFGVSFVSGLIEPMIGYQAVGYVFLLGVLAVGALAGVGPTFLYALSSLIIWNYFFIPPRFTFHISRVEDFMMCFTYLVVALITGFLTHRVRSHERLIRNREERTQTLNEILQDISVSQNKDEFLGRVTERLSQFLGGDCGIILRGADGKLQTSKSRPYSSYLSEKEQAVATWAFEAQKKAGWSTDTLSESGFLFIPMISPNEILGVLTYKPQQKTKGLDIEQENLLYAVGKQLAIALQRHFYEKRARLSQKLEESEKLHQTLLNSISHEMRTPLTTIMAASTSLVNDELATNTTFVKASAHQLVEASDRLNRVIENLLDMTRLNSGLLTLNLESHELSEIIAVISAKLGKHLNNHQLVVDVSEDLPQTKIDFRLMEHALSNIILNAIHYTPQGSKIRLSARKYGKNILLFIDDEGQGIPEEYLTRVFEKFYRVPGTPAGGAGLGLSIVKGIVEAHKGKIWAENLPGLGVRFSIELPI